MPAQNSFQFRRGEDVVITYTLRQSDSATSAPVDLTGASFSFKMKRNARDADPSLVTASISILDALNGQLAVAINSSDLQALDGNYHHSLWRTNSGSKSCFDDGFTTIIDTVES